MTPMYPNLGLKAMLYIFSFSQDENSAIINTAAELSNLIEAVIVNNEVPPKYRTKTLNGEVITDPSRYLDKIHRDKYKNEQLKFLDILKTTSVKLKNYDIEERNPILQSKLRELNRWIIKDLRTWEIDHESDYEVKFHGIMIPLHEGDDRDPAIIVNLVVEMAKSFNTKQRCPISIVFETIDLSEAISRKDDLTEITEIAYNQFQQVYSAQKSSKKMDNMFEINKMEKLQGDSDPDDFIVVDQDD
jgi:hypothetical protein